MADRLVDRPEIAARLGVSERRITQLVKDGALTDGTRFPSRVEGRERRFPSDRCFEWYIRFKQEEAVARAAPQAPSNIIEAELRKAIADAELQEMRVAKMRGDLVEKGLFRAELERAFGLVRSRLTAAPGEYASRCVMLADVPAAVVVLRDVMTAAMLELQSASTDDASEAGGEDVAA